MRWWALALLVACGRVDFDAIGELAADCTCPTAAFAATTRSQVAKLPAGGTNFGASIAISGDGTAVAVGAPVFSGAVFVFGGTPVAQIAVVTGSNTEGNDEFGSSVALSDDGSVLAVGAFGEASNATGIDGNQADNSATEAGAAYVFTRVGNAYTQTAYIKASDTQPFYHFGDSVALSGDGATLAVTGLVVYVFHNSGTWSQQAYVPLPGAPHGVALSRDGSTLVSADATFDELDVYAGPPTWAPQAQHLVSTLPDGSLAQQTGWSIAMSDDGSTFVATSVSAPASMRPSQCGAPGGAFVYTRTGTSWTQAAVVGPLNGGQGDEFGYGVSMSGDGSSFAIGAPLEAGAVSDPCDQSVMRAGAVYEVSRGPGDWSSQTYIKAADSTVNTQFGFHVALSQSASTLAVVGFGTPGALYLFR